MYYGEHPTNLDDKGRITMPRSFRTTMEENDHHAWIMTIGYDRCIFLFNMPEWERISEQVARSPSLATEAFDFQRMFYGSVTKVKPDGQGRMLVPQSLREYAGLTKEAVILGVKDHLEIWDKEHWRKFQADRLDAFKEMGAKLFSAQTSESAVEAEGGTNDAS